MRNLIAITGANGQLGSTIIDHLLNLVSNDRIIPIVRDQEKSQSFKERGMSVRIADYADLRSYLKVLEGVKVLIQISTTSVGEQGIKEEANVVGAAKAHGVEHIIYTSSLAPSLNHEFQGATQAYATESEIKLSQIPYTFFRNSLYMEVIPRLVDPSCLQEGILPYPASNGRISFVSSVDIAEAIAKVVAHPERHKNQAYEITGSQSFTFNELADKLQKEKNRVFQYVDISIDEYQDSLNKYEIPRPVIKFLSSMAKGIQKDEFALVTNTLEELLERKPTDLNQYLKSL
jgi:NAD(P)H dehydrogenase (quinone)